MNVTQSSRGHSSTGTSEYVIKVWSCCGQMRAREAGRPGVERAAVGGRGGGRGGCGAGHGRLHGARAAGRRRLRHAHCLCRLLRTTRYHCHCGLQSHARAYAHTVADYALCCLVKKRIYV